MLSPLPIIAVDGSHLRGKYLDVLLVAVTKLFPATFSFMKAEGHDRWEWFFANLFLALVSIQI